MKKYIDAYAFANSLRQFCKDAHWGNAERRFSLDQIRSALELQPTADVRKNVYGEWIPATERLPETEDYVLVNHRFGFDIAHYKYHDVWLDGYDHNIPPVFAWMPLPDEYKEANE